MKKYMSYEAPYKGEEFDEVQMREVYRDMADKEEYPTFDIWFEDMLKMGIFTEIKGDDEYILSPVDMETISDAMLLLVRNTYKTTEQIDDSRAREMLESRNAEYKALLDKVCKLIGGIRA